MADVWGAKHEENQVNHQEPYVEGVGNEVLLGLGASCIAIVIPILVSVLVKRTSNIQIHPDEAENVRATRETLGVVGENANTINQDSDENERPNPPRNINAGEPCPICLAQPRLLVITNCGHGFCGICLTTYWRTRFPFRAMTCPVCRQQISMLFMGFTEDDTTEEAASIRNSVYQYNRRFSSRPRSIMDYIRDLPTLLRQMYHEFFSVSGLVLVLRFRIVLCFVAAILYLLSPIDILSEAAFGLLGFLDDIVVMFLLLFYVCEIYRNVVTERAETALG